MFCPFVVLFPLYTFGYRRASEMHETPNLGMEGVIFSTNLFEHVIGMISLPADDTRLRGRIRQIIHIISSLIRTAVAINTFAKMG